MTRTSPLSSHESGRYRRRANDFNFFTQDLYNTTVVATDKVACCALDHFVGYQIVIFPFNSPSSLPCPSQGINMEQ